MIVRLCALAGTTLDPSAREDSKRVASLVSLGRSELIPSMPWSASGSVSEWQFVKAQKPVGSVQALTDNVTVLLKAPSGSTSFRVGLRDLGASEETTEWIEFAAPPKGPIPLVITHTSPLKTPSPATLHHLQAFAVLTNLQQHQYPDFPIAKFVRGIHGEAAPPVWIMDAKRSDEDGHCPFVRE